MMLTPLTLALSLAYAADVPPPPHGSGLVLPPEGECIAARSAPLGLDDAAVAAGLAVIRTALDGCLGGSDGMLDADVHINCSGRVDDVVAYHGGGLGPDAAACVMDSLHYAAFPAHDESAGIWVSLVVEPTATVAAPMRVAAADAPPVAAALTEAAACDDPLVRSACSQGDREACASLAAAMLQSDSTCYGPSEARRTLLLACPDGSSPAGACLMLGQAFEEGVGGERDRTSASGYYDWACLAGAAEACWRRGTLLSRGVGVRRNDELALKSHQTGCELGDARCCQAAGFILDEGAIVARDAEAALPLYQRACEAGVGDGCVGAGRLLEESDDHAAALALYEEGAGFGSAEAMRRAARMLWNGIGADADKKKAKTLCADACQAGDSAACRGPQYL